MKTRPRFRKRMVTSGFECRGDEDLAPLVGRRAVRAVVSPVGQVADLDLRLDDGGRIELFTSWPAASWRLETP